MTLLPPPPHPPSPPPSETTENDVVSDEEDVKFTLMSNSSGDSVESAGDVNVSVSPSDELFFKWGFPYFSVLATMVTGSYKEWHSVIISEFVFEDRFENAGMSVIRSGFSLLGFGFQFQIYCIVSRAYGLFGWVVSQCSLLTGFCVKLVLVLEWRVTAYIEWLQSAVKGWGCMFSSANVAANSAGLKKNDFDMSNKLRYKFGKYYGSSEWVLGRFGDVPKRISKEVDIIKKTENQAKMTKLSMEWKRLCKIKAKVQKCQSQSQYRRISSQTGAGTEEYYWMQS
ncbi:hypothetical protein Tco_0086930 [Tanacetum coccineum]